MKREPRLKNPIVSIVIWFASSTFLALHPTLQPEPLQQEARIALCLPASFLLRVERANRIKAPPSLQRLTACGGSVCTTIYFSPQTTGWKNSTPLPKKIEIGCFSRDTVYIAETMSPSFHLPHYCMQCTPKKHRIHAVCGVGT